MGLFIDLTVDMQDSPRFLVSILCYRSFVADSYKKDLSNILDINIAAISELHIGD